MAKEYRAKNSTSSLVGKLPPQATDLEQAVLGVLMLEKNRIHEVSDLLRPDMFYYESHQHIYRAITTLHGKHHPIDSKSVTAELRQQGKIDEIGGAYYLLEITNNVTGSEQIEFWIRIIMQKFLQREMIRSSSEVINEAYLDTSDPFEILNTMSDFVNEAQLGFIGSNEKHIADIATEVSMSRMDAPKNDHSIHGLETGVYELDKLIDGFLPGELVVVAARPAMGKTAVICSIAKNINIDLKTPLAIFSLEMSYKQIYLRLQSNHSGINGKKIRQNDLTEEESELLDYTDGQLSNGSLIIDDTSFINIAQVVSRIRMYVRKYGVKGVLIDYLQLIQGMSERGGNRESEISHMTRALKVAAGDLGIPIIILAQLSREVEKRKPLCLPQLADLRESGAIEQDADKVIFLWRPEYYNVTEDTNFRLFNKQISNRNLLVFIVAKHREGELGNVPALFTPYNMRVTNHPDLITSELPTQLGMSLTGDTKKSLDYQPPTDGTDPEPDAPF